MISKSYTKTGRSCRVTFEAPAGLEAESVAVAGEFNDWEAVAMKKRRGGGFSVTLSLKPGSQYRFKYLVNSSRWENDDAADRYVPNEFGTEDSVIAV